MTKKWMRVIALSLMSFLIAFGCIACRKPETPSFIKEYLCVEHTYGEGEVLRWATCAREGRVKYECTECGAEKYESIYSAEHTPYTVAAKAATCAEDGYAEHTACAVCEKTLTEKRIIPKTFQEHISNVVYKGNGNYQCSVCAVSYPFYTQRIISTGNIGYEGWYRCYYGNAGVLLSITKKSGNFGYYVNESGANITIKEIQIRFSENYNWAEKGNLVLIGSDGSSVCASADNLLTYRGPDYCEVAIPFNSGAVTYEGKTKDGNNFSIKVFDVRPTMKVTVGAKFVYLVDAPVGEYVMGSVLG